MKIKSSRTIKGPKELIWPYLADFGNIYKFHPMLSDSHYLQDSASCEVGATRQCDFKDGKNYLRERITDVVEGSRYSIEIYDSSMPIANAKATLGLRKIDGDTTEAYMEVEMDVTNPLMAPMMYTMYKFKGIPGILKGLDDLYNEERQLSMAS